MKRQSILFILLLLLTLFASVGCGNSTDAKLQTIEAMPEEASFEEFSLEAAFDEESTKSSPAVENVSGVFEGLEDNHTALFSFDGAETAFFFEDPAVRTVLSEAVVGSTYTLSYHYDTESGLQIIYEISE